MRSFQQNKFTIKNTVVKPRLGKSYHLSFIYCLQLLKIKHLVLQFSFISFSVRQLSLCHYCTRFGKMTIVVCFIPGIKFPVHCHFSNSSCTVSFRFLFSAVLSHNFFLTWQTFPEIFSITYSPEHFSFSLFRSKCVFSRQSTSFRVTGLILMVRLVSKRWYLSTVTSRFICFFKESSRNSLV